MRLDEIHIALHAALRDLDDALRSLLGDEPSPPAVVRELLERGPSGELRPRRPSRSCRARRRSRAPLRRVQ